MCKAGEVELDGQYRGRQPGDPELEDSSGSEGEDEPDAGALEDSSDSGGLAQGNGGSEPWFD